jgi:hypothetical protein
MPGGLLNIVAYGNQNIILNGNPSKTFFKTVYAKYTNFGIQKFRIDYDGSRVLSAEQDSTYTFRIPRHAELLLDSYLSIQLPDIYSPILPPITKGDVWKPYHFKWIRNIGTSIIKNVKFIIGEQVIQEYPGEYIRCVVERDFSEAKRRMFNIMSGNVIELNEPQNFGNNRSNNYPNVFFNPNLSGSEPSIRGRRIYIPLNPWFMNDSKVALPLVCLQYSEVKIEVTLRPIKEIFTINNVDGIELVDEDEDTPVTNSEGVLINYSYQLDYESNLDSLYERRAPKFSNENEQMYNFLQQPPTIELTRDDYENKENIWNADVHLICNYCFLTQEESSIFAYNEQKFLIKDIKYSKFFNITGSTKIKVDTNALVSNWMWFYRRNDIYERNEWSNYTNWKTDKIPYHLNDGELVTPYNVGNTEIGPGNDFNLSDIENKFLTNHKVTPNYSIENTKNILMSFGILIDGKYRENSFDSEIYKYIEKYRCSKGYTDDGIYNYNFCLHTSPQNLQPSGALNLSRFRKIELEMTVLAPPIDELSENITLCDAEGNIIGVQESDIYKYDYEMHLFEERYNILRFISGNGGLLFAR